MDPVTHALVGSAVARVGLTRTLGRSAWLPGAAGALLPDADALIRSSADPLLYAEFHRHFTHALAFIPVGGAIAALPWILAPRTRHRWRAYVAAAALGYATHGVLDASTTYGTLLYWPFSSARVAWNLISIVDPLFTAIVAVGVLAAAWRRTATAAAVALAIAAGYLVLGLVQRERAEAAQVRVADARGHARDRGAVFPAFATNLVWRSLYQSGGRLHADRIRLPWFGAPQWRSGYDMPLVEDRHLPGPVTAQPRLRRDFARFHWFTSGWVARAAHEPEILGDARYSDSVERFEPVWGIRLRPDSAEQPTEWIDRSRERRVDPRAVWDELRGADAAYRPVPPGF